MTRALAALVLALILMGLLALATTEFPR